MFHYSFLEDKKKNGGMFTKQCRTAEIHQRQESNSSLEPKDALCVLA